MAAKATDLCVRCHGAVKVAAARPDAHKALQQGCIKCHTPHAANEKGLVRGRDERALCLSCHKDISKLLAGAVSIHPLKAAGGRCTACHAPHASDQKPLLKAARADVCKDCHKSHSQFAHPYGPGVNDPRTGQTMTCLSCHNPHASQYSSLAVAAPSRALCVQCHKDTPEEEKERRKKTAASANAPGGGQ
jgi:predicted CXXCH cytochrome family protein